MGRRQDTSEVVAIPVKTRGKKAKKAVLGIIIAFLALVLLGVAAVFIYFSTIGINYIGRDNTKTPVQNNDDVLFENMDDDDKEQYHNMITAIRDDSDISTTLYNWYKNGGDHMSSHNVINILIIGIDATGNQPMQGNSDVMMLASVNKKEQKITLCSFLRDSYTYFETDDGDGYYSKLNAAYSYGGADCLMNAIENNYKIKLDYFVAVDFEAFEKVIDAVGGINMDLEEYEAQAMQDYAGITGIPHGGNVTLNGEQALLYARMRKIYATGDVHRTENQRKVINALIKKSRTLGVSDLNNVVQTLGQYVYTDCPTTKIISLGTNAILGKWYNFQVYSMDAPPTSAREEYNGSSWMWMVDYPYSAQYVQKQIFGETNIVIQ